MQQRFAAAPAGAPDGSPETRARVMDYIERYGGKAGTRSAWPHISTAIISPPLVNIALTALDRHYQADGQRMSRHASLPPGPAQGLPTDRLVLVDDGVLGWFIPPQQLVPDGLG